MKQCTECGCIMDDDHDGDVLRVLSGRQILRRG